ncbi:MAG: hypothetical protein Q4D04_09510 [Clostridia bacterium]|nr:hypothetical protein [Clostridia bacterium]
MIPVKFYENLGKIPYIRPIAVIAIIAAICLILSGMNERTDGGTDVLSAETQLEARLASVLSAMDGVGECRVMINADEGVLIVAKGAEDISVRLEIIRAVRALLGVESERVEVLAMGD